MHYLFSMEQTINKSKTYLLPLFDGFVDIRFLSYIINTYTYTGDCNEQALHILYSNKVEKEAVFGSYYTTIHHSSYFINIKHNKEGILLSLKIPKQHIEDYKHFIAGEYSLLIENSKQKILHHLYSNYPTLYETIRVIEKVLYKDEQLKDNIQKRLQVHLSDSTELSSRIDNKLETYS